MPSSSKCCSICLDDMALTPKLQQISCTNQHSIHIGCFTKMGVISGKTNCPLCRDVMRCITCGHEMKRVICLPCYVDQLDHPRHHHENEPNDWMPAHCVWAVVSLMLMSHLDRVAFPISYRLNGLMSVINSLLAADSWILRLMQEMQARRRTGGNGHQRGLGQGQIGSGDGGGSNGPARRTQVGLRESHHKHRRAVEEIL